MMEAKAPAAGMKRSLSYVGFDIIPASNHANFVLKSWFDLKVVPSNQRPCSLEKSTLRFIFFL
jgi:hypothetical protein